MCLAVIAASLLRFLDPFTSVYQTDDLAEGAALASMPGYWAAPNGLVDPLAEKLKPRIIHTEFRVAAEPFAGYDENVPSDLFKVNQVGYLPWAPKFAYIGAWLGPKFGAWRPHTPMASWRLVDAASGDTVLESAQPPSLRVLDGETKEGTPFTGEETYEMDFSSVTNEGVYFVSVPGVGRSETFRISASAAEDAFRVHMGGLYQKRCGIAKTEPYTHWQAGACHTSVVRGRFPPDEGKLEPKVKHFEIIRDNTDWERGERIKVSGGWHDAADYDRRPRHLNIVNDLCAVYLMRPENFRDGQLLVPENANGIPDILDEAEWGLRHLLAVQQPNGGVGTWIETTRHPVPGNVAEKDEMRYAVSRATRASSMAYAAHASLLARCHPAFREKYLESAIKAWKFALSQKPAVAVFEIKKTHHRFFTNTEAVYWSEDRDLPAQSLVKAAVNLHALTGDDAFLAPVIADMKRMMSCVKHDAWNWSPLYFSGERTFGYPPELKDFFAAWERRTLNVANEIYVQIAREYAYRAPWFGPMNGKVSGMAWGQSHPLRRAQYLVAAHGMTGDEKYLRAASLANDYHNGCNPSGSTLTSGLGRVYPVTFLDLPSYVDDIVEYVPGITPYRWTYKMPKKAIEWVFGGRKDRAALWPMWRRWPNMENQTVAVSEYTVWETIAPAASVTGYLMAPGDSLPEPRPQPAKRLSDLPGYWALP